MLTKTVRALHDDGRVVAVQPELAAAAQGAIARELPSARKAAAKPKGETTLPSSRAQPSATMLPSTWAIDPEPITDRTPPPRGR